MDTHYYWSLRKCTTCVVRPVWSAVHVHHVSPILLTYFILQVQISSSLHQLLNNFSLTALNSLHQCRISLLYGLCINTLSQYRNKNQQVNNTVLLHNNYYLVILYIQSDQLFMYIMCLLHYWHTLFCRFKSAPPSTSSLTTPVLPLRAASISAECPSCMYIMYCVLTHWTCCCLNWDGLTVAQFTVYTCIQYSYIPELWSNICNKYQWLIISHSKRGLTIGNLVHHRVAYRGECTGISPLQFEPPELGQNMH